MSAPMPARASVSAIVAMMVTKPATAAIATCVSVLSWFVIKSPPHAIAAAMGLQSFQPQKMS